MTTHTGTQSVAKLKKNLVLWHIIIIGLAYIQPMTLFDTFGLVSEKSSGHVPTSYIFALVAILLTSISYGHMIRRYPSSGSAYTYAQKSIHPNVGFMVGWSSWLDYLLSPLVNIILADIYLRALYPSVNHWYWVIGLSAFMTIINLFGARFVARFNTTIVVIQLGVIFYFVYQIYILLTQGIHADGTLNQDIVALWSLAPFWSDMANVGALIAGATILCFSFTGFDALSSLAEETKDAEKTLPRAIFLTALIAGAIFVFSTYFIQLFFPSDPNIYFSILDESQPEMMAALGNIQYILPVIGAIAFKTFVLYFAVVAVMASGISAHAGVSRLMYVMGRDGIINKKIFGHISPRLHTPTYNILIVGLIALTAGFINLEHIVNLISFGALTAFSFVNFSVISRYALRDKQTKSLKDIFNYIVIPTLGFISVFLMWLEIDPTALKVGLAWAAIGIAYLAYKTGGFTRPVPQYNEFED
ncbi:APC family permease [Acinetobacter populi]|uniref:Putrescine/spermidine ABC transporter n=1 Tax=Acinetobacter populi TaxID=1582270 RepID=A0A1Z9Z1K8_9GAMM|nr:APC family permease [Acinetobacter populi]MCH4246321.1 APC family permease [Acinetobacter populi]OUY08363.1 putrescine/spermidine ABC transporter [Acinetobacter populi]